MLTFSAELARSIEENIGCPFKFRRRFLEPQRLKDVSRETVPADFAQCCREKHLQDILRVDRKLHKRTVESSTQICDFIDIAEVKVG